MVTQYPHTATVTVPGAATTAPNGDLTPGANSTVTFPCRAEPASSGAVVPGVDGSVIRLVWSLYAPQGVAPVPIGSTIVVSASGGTLCTGTVKRFFPGQLNTRLWL